VTEFPPSEPRSPASSGEPAAANVEFQNLFQTMPLSAELLGLVASEEEPSLDNYGKVEKVFRECFFEKDYT
jgi:hypothetical protein